MADAAALDDLPQAGGDDIVLHIHAQALAEGVDAAEPVLHAGEQLHTVAALHQKLSIQPDILRLALLDHGIHIGQQAVHAVGEAEGVGLFPELGGLVAQRGDEGVVLHVGGAEGLVKVVQQGDDGSVHKKRPPCGVCGVTGKKTQRPQSTPLHFFVFSGFICWGRSSGRTSARPDPA